MSRVIKFRFWDNVKSEMDHSDNINGYEVWNMFSDDRFEAMQFTGLTDKNGVDIYSGDIVFADGNNSKYTVCNGEHELPSHYDNSPHDCTGFYLSRHNTAAWSECESIGGDCSMLKIIGNIHQNKDLLS